MVSFIFKWHEISFVVRVDISGVFYQLLLHQAHSLGSPVAIGYTLFAVKVPVEETFEVATVT